MSLIVPHMMVSMTLDELGGEEEMRDRLKLDQLDVNLGVQ